MAKIIQFKTCASDYDGAFNDKVGWAAAGMGYVVVSDGGRLMVIDGGFESDSERLYGLLRGLSKGKGVTVDEWIITHPHIDHYGAFMGIVKRKDLDITVKRLIYRFSEQFDPSGALSLMREAAEQLGAETLIPERDDTFTLDGVTVRFLYVPDDVSVLVTANGNANYTSLIFEVSAERKAVFTGDAYPRSLQITAWRYATALKCDILQMPHHALCDAYNGEFYRFAAPKTVLMPISVAGYRAMHEDKYAFSEGGIANLALESRADCAIKAFEGDIVVRL